MTTNPLNCSCCPKCGGKLRVLHTREHTSFDFVTARRRKVCSCGERITTVEVPLALAEDVFGGDE